MATSWVTQMALQHVPPGLGHAGEAPGCFLPDQRFGETFAQDLLGSRKCPQIGTVPGGTQAEQVYDFGSCHCPLHPWLGNSRDQQGPSRGSTVRGGFVNRSWSW